MNEVVRGARGPLNPDDQARSPSLLATPFTGRFIVNVPPRPTILSTLINPPCIGTIFFAREGELRYGDPDTLVLYGELMIESIPRSRLMNPDPPMGLE
jgi:hypothetical protein